MKLLLTGGAVFLDGRFQNLDVAISDGRIVSVSPALPKEGFSVIELHSRCLVPGFVDVHVHLREPGFSYKETVFSGTAAAAAGGYTAVCAMPNLSPVPDSPEHLRAQLDIIEKNAKVRVYPYGAITMGERGEAMADLAALAPYVPGFSDDGRGVQSEERMREAMVLAKSLDRPIAAHCEDESLLQKGWCVHSGDFARRNGLPGNDPASEWRQVERDLGLVRETGCQYHVCHVSAQESVSLIREAKARGVDVTCETGPHYLVFCDGDLREDGRFKMNPPIRSREDRAALIEGLRDGTIDMIATDHAPHSAEEKGRGLEKSAMGVVGLETAFAAVYTHLVKPGILSMERLMALLNGNAAKRFGFGTPLEAGQPADLTVFDLDKPYAVDPARFQTMGRATPFAGMELYGVCKLTMVDGRIVWQEGNE